MLNYIHPNPSLVTQARTEIRQKLLESLHHLVFEVFNSEHAAPISETELCQLISGTTGYPSPVVFALHGAMLKAALEGNMSEIPELLRTLKGMLSRDIEQTSSICVTSLSEPDMHPDDVQLLKRAFADDLGLTTALTGPSQQDADRAQKLIEEALQLLDHAEKDWSHELKLLSNQIYLAVAAEHGAQRFGGAAVFDAFGSVLMNPIGFRDVPTVLMALIHESSHQQMFLFHLNDPILLNDETAAFTSPLRRQPRPMEGIFHAFWVSSRMVIAAEDVLTDAQNFDGAQDLRQQQAQALSAFRDCEQTIAEHAKLTEFGATLFQQARGTINAI